ncbi:GYD domain-containing protein [Archangium violaceum]|uniref:GYD domain-containing protein n=1 Tax=Archangium violaceum TaxID=83451 RepID=UPI00193B398C|nr:GYD domain-containing protein [Archangium violaceum]QRK08318.1 GYD domain-containing protein [Archangium violaceum]
MQYMILARYKAEVLKNLLQNPDSLEGREDYAQKFYGSVGGKVMHSYFIRGAKWHFLVIVDFPDAEAAHTAVMVGYASGAFEEGELHHLATMDEAVSALRRASAGGVVYFPPK